MDSHKKKKKTSTVFNKKLFIHLSYNILLVCSIYIYIYIGDLWQVMTAFLTSLDYAMLYCLQGVQEVVHYLGSQKKKVLLFQRDLHW